ncbi:atp4 subunit B of the stator stalk of mitochondrial F1F0 ATP synthase [Gonapodya sp. JEL0774]|nr:atp4 subunit B of the stator stalk of mitochondrial F1F0 ATP synthase [Gonapodya sp. JEL0774]
MAAMRTAAAAMQKNSSAPIFIRAVLPASSSALLPARRLQSTQAKPAPEQVALNLVNLAPGKTLAHKAGFISVAASVAAYVVSKEVYIFDVETLEAIPMVGAFTIAYLNLKDMLLQIFEDQKKRINDILVQAREDHKAVVEERLDHVSKLGDVVGVTKNLYEVSREIAHLEAEAYELKQQVALQNEIRSTLDGWVRYEASVRERRQREVAQYVIDRVTAQLESPEAQDSILKQALRDVERVAKKA